jgi:hypothetical protein
VKTNVSRSSSPPRHTGTLTYGVLLSTITPALQNGEHVFRMTGAIEEVMLYFLPEA